MKIFITGGTGFIGKPVVELLKRDNHILMLSRNLKDIGEWEHELIEFVPDACIHMAWEGLPDYSEYQSRKNLEYGINLYKVLRKANCNKIITTGSCWECSSSNNPFVEAKGILYDYGHFMFPGIFIWARLFYVFGPNQRKDSLIPTILNALNNNEVPEIKSPNSAHDFIYVDDVARAIVDLLKTDKSGIYNIGSGHLTKVKEILADIYGIKMATGWEPSISVKEGIRKIIDET